MVGLNGSGKTTLLRTLHGEWKPVSGEMHWQGNPIGRGQVAFLETEPFFYPKITGREYLSLFMVANPDFDLEGWNRLFHLPLDELIEHYSTGMKKKLALMAVLGRDKPVLLLDEPFNGLDMEAVFHVKAILEELAKTDKLILVTSHILGPITALCREVHYLAKGAIRQVFGPESFGEIEQLIEADLEHQPRDMVKKLLSS